jgi:hypothetical protein
MSVPNFHGLIVRPGDTLLLCTEQRLSDAEVDDLRMRVREKLPDLAGIAVLEGFAALAVYRPDPEPS